METIVAVIPPEGLREDRVETYTEILQENG